jgi:hypothetical protein
LIRRAASNSDAEIAAWEAEVHAERVAMLEQTADPVVKAHDALKDYRYKVAGGLTRDDFVQTWPDTYAQVRRHLVDEYQAAPKEELSQAEADTLTLYWDAVAEATDLWSEARNKTSSLVQGTKQDCPTSPTQCTPMESAVGTALDAAVKATDALDAKRTDALLPRLER